MIQSVRVVEGIFDHDIVIADLDVAHKIMHCLKEKNFFDKKLTQRKL